MEAGVATWVDCLRFFPLPLAEAAKTTVRRAAFMFPYMIPFLGITILRARYRSKKK